MERTSNSTTFTSLISKQFCRTAVTHTFIPCNTYVTHCRHNKHVSYSCVRQFMLHFHTFYRPKYSTFCYSFIYYRRGRQPVARGTIFNGTLSELKYNNYDLIKNWIFNSIEAYNSFKAIPVFTSPQIENRQAMVVRCKLTKSVWSDNDWPSRSCICSYLYYNFE